jgi:hypothetical protein
VCSTKILVIVAMILLLVCPSAFAGTRTHSETANELRKDLADVALILLDTNSVQEMKASIRFIEEQGGKIVHVYPTHVLIGSVPRELRPSLIGRMGIEDITYDLADPKEFSRHGRPTEAAIEAWNNNFKGRGKLAGLEPPADFVDPPPIEHDLLKRPSAPSGSAGGAFAPTFGLGVLQAPDVYDTSEYFMGEVAVGIVLPESTGAQENWSTERQNNVISEIQAAMDWWAAREANARLTFVYDVRLSVQTTYEPITLPQASEGLWIAEVMANLGYTSGSGYFARVYSYLNSLRSTLGTDWAFAIFVVDSNNDADGYFSDGYFAYAYLGGPFMVMTYDNDGYSIFNMDAVTAHETGHIFYAQDQYQSAGVSCTIRTGYLNVENQNSAYPFPGACISNVASIMRSQVAPYTSGAVDTYARQQVGWRDSDSDTVMDILDFEPDTTLSAYSPDPTVDSTPTYTGSAIASTSVYPNSNPSGYGHSISINRIANVQYRIDSGPWISAVATDGAFDETSEAFTFTTTSLSDGTYTFQARAVHTGGAADSTPASDALTIITRYQLTIAVNPVAGGSTDPATGSYWHDVGTLVAVAATAATGYSFYYWSLDGANVGTNPSYSALMNSAHILTAMFRSTSSISASMLVAPDGFAWIISGTITPTQSSPGIPTGTPVTLSYSSDSGGTWSNFITVLTSSGGNYSVYWQQPYQYADFRVRASWNGNTAYEGSTSSHQMTSGTYGPFYPPVNVLVSGSGSVARGGSATFDVLVTCPSSYTLDRPLYVTVVGPNGYQYFDTVRVTLSAGETRRYQFIWQAPSTLTTGTYQVYVGLIPPNPAAIDQTQITVT